MTRLPPRPRPLKKPDLFEVWQQLRPGTRPPELQRNIPFMSQEKTNRLFLALVVRLVQLEDYKEEVLTNPIFFAWVFFGVVGYYTTLRTFYKDQFWTYGVRQQLPGVAHQVQQQKYTTFQYITAPTAVEHARRLGTKISESAENESPVIQFLETPFLKRLDMYPNAALVEMSPQWGSLVGENYTAFTEDLLLRSPSEDTLSPQPKVKGIPFKQTVSTINPVEYQPRHSLRLLDPWTRHRLLFDLADQVPTRLEDTFNARFALARMKQHPLTLPSINLAPVSFSPRDADAVSETFTTAKVDILDLQQRVGQRAPVSWIYGLPSQAPENPGTKLPIPMLDVTEKSLEPSPTYQRELGHADLGYASPIASRWRLLVGRLDDAFSRQNNPQDDSAVLPKLAKTGAPESLSTFPYDFSLSHDIVSASPAFDLFVLTGAEADMPSPPTMPVIEPPMGYELYRARRQLLAKKPETGPLVDLMQNEVVENLDQYPKDAKNFIEALREYLRVCRETQPDNLSPEDRREERRDLRAAGRRYAHVQAKIQDLTHYWRVIMPQAFLDHLQKTGAASADLSKYNPDVDGSPAVVDWFARIPMSRADWETIISKLISARRKEPFRLIRLHELTLDETREFLNALFGWVDLTALEPADLESDVFRKSLYHTLNYMTEALMDDAENTNYVPFYRLLQRHDLSKGPKQKRFAFFRKRESLLPPALNLRGGETNLAALVGDRAFYAPMKEWLDRTYVDKEANFTFTLPKGAEFHWALHAQDFLSRPTMQSSAAFGHFVGTHLAKVHPRYAQMLDVNAKGISVGERLVRLQRSERLRTVLRREVQLYLRRVAASPIMKDVDLRRVGEHVDEKLLPVEASPTLAASPETADFIRSLKYATLERRATNSFMAFMSRQAAFAQIRTYRQDWSRPQPHMGGFLFPDTDTQALRHQLQMSHLRYKLDSTSLWDMFQAVTLRPMEIVLPPGYRPFVSRTLPDFSRPRPVDYRQVKVFPHYEVSRESSELPPYDVLKKRYPDLDLDVSFLAEEPKPTLRLPVTYRFISVEDWEPSNPEEGEPYVKLTEEDDPITIPAGTYANYFEHPTTLAHTYGDLNISPSTRNLIYDYYLGAQNWIKDMPRNFLGNQGFTRGDTAEPFIRKTQLEQVKNYSTAYEKTLFAGPAPGPRLPSQLEEGTIVSVKRPELLAASVKAAFLKVPDVLGENKDTRHLTKHTPHLEAYPILTLPQLSVAEWYDIFKTSVDRARLTGESTLDLDIPPIQPIVYYRPTAFEGMIHVDPLAGEDKQRSQALAQILLLASEAKLGAYNIPDYVHPRALQGLQGAPPMSGVRRDILPIFWHYQAPRLVCVETTGQPLYNWVNAGNLTNVSSRWGGAKSFLAEQQVQRNPIKRIIAALVPTEVLGIEPQIKNYEPITIYSWFLCSQFLLIPFVLGLAKWVKFLVIRDFYTELHYRIYPLFQHNPYAVLILAKSLRRCYRWTGQIPYKPFRVFKNIKRRFTDIVGIEPDVLINSADIAASLRNKGRGGPASPKGVLLFGPPGNGKTFLVQAIAGEANVPLVALTTSELLDKRQHDSSVDALIEAFTLARTLAPCILFIDEIDGLGKKRSSMLEHETEAPNPENNLWAFVRKVPHRTTLPFVMRGQLNKAYVEAASLNPILAEKELRKRSLEGLIDRKRYNFDTEDDFKPEISTNELPAAVNTVLSPTESARTALLTTFLTLMDGLRPHQGIVVIGATNRRSVLDPAVRRAGRLDIQIAINAPSEERRVEILRFYISRLGLQDTVSWDYMADRTRAYSIADLETMVNQSAMMAILKDEQHTLASLEDALEATSRHRHIRANRIPYPVVTKVPQNDPLFFIRIAYYQASRALVHNILPHHPTLPFVQMQLEPFAPEVPIAELIRRPYTLRDLEDRLAAMLAGKAGEFLLLYGSPFKNQDQLNERQLFESNLGVEELGYAVDLAYAIVDQWLLIDEFTIPLQKALKLQEGENDEAFFEPGGDPGRPHFMRYSLEEASKQHYRNGVLLPSMFDKKFRVHNTLTDTLRWFADTKASLNLITESFVKWSCLFTQSPFERNVWEPIEQFYAKRPHFKLLKPYKKPDPNEKMNDIFVRPTYPDLAKVDRDYLMQAVILKCFNNALELLDTHRTVVERMADHLLRAKKLRSYEMYEFIQAYTAELRQVKPETKVRTELVKGEMPDLRTKPDSRLRTINGVDYLVIDQSWGPESLKPDEKTILTSVFAEGREASLWDGQVTFDTWKQPTKESDFLTNFDQRLRGERGAYIARYARVAARYLNLYRQQILAWRVKRDVEESFVEELLLSMAPAVDFYVNRVEGPKTTDSPQTGDEDQTLNLPPTDQTE